MAKGKKTFIFYSDWINMIREMDNIDAGELLKHILSYVNDENPETKNPFVRMAFGHMKPLIKEDLKKWELIREKRKKAGAKGGKKTQANAKQMLSDAKQVQAVNDNVNVNVNVNIEDIDYVYNKFVDEVKEGKHDSKIDVIYMQLKIRRGSLKTLLDEFKGVLIKTDKAHKNTAELFKHFDNWLNVQDRVGKLDKYRIVKKAVI